MKQLSLVLIAGLILWSGRAQAACGLGISTSNVSTTWSMGLGTIAVPITVTKSLAPACQWGIGITKGSAANYTSRAVTVGASYSMFYQIYSDNGLSSIVKDKPDITAASDVIQGSFNGGTNQTQIVNYYINIPTSPASPLAHAGTYTDTYTISIYEGSDPLSFGAASASASITLTVTTNNLIQLKLTDSGGTYAAGSSSRNVNFGTLSEGQSNSLDLVFRTNSGYSVTFSSANNGRMKHSVPTKNSYVPYTIYLNGSALNLSTSATTPVVALSGPGQTNESGISFPMKIVVGSFSTPGAVSGTHSDTVTITAVTTE